MLHFALGAFLLSLASSAQAIEIPVGGVLGWRIQKYENITAAVGDILLFVYEPRHTVVAVDNLVCNMSNKVRLAGKLDSPFRLELVAPGTLIVASDIPGDCLSGMVAAINVGEGAAAGEEDEEEEEEEEEGDDDGGGDD